MRLFEDDAEFFSDAKTPASLPVLDDKNSNDIRTQSTIDEHNEGESLRRSEATGKDLSSSVEESLPRITASTGPSFLTKLLILLIPMLLFVGYYGYSQVKGATARPVVSVDSGNIKTIDSAGNVGSYTSIAVGTDGYPAIAYYDATNGDLKFAKCNDTSCSSTTIRSLDTTGAVGPYPSIAIGQDGYPVIAYLDGTANDLKFAKCNDTSCSSTTIRSLDTTGAVGYYTSIAVGADGYPVIAYQRISINDLKFLKCNDDSCSTTAIQTLDSADDVGYYTSIAVGVDGYPVITYFDNTNLDLKFLKCNDTACSSSAIQTLDSVGIVGSNSSVTIGNDGYPVIAYLDSTNGDLKFAKCTDSSCASTTIRSLDTVGAVGQYPSVAIGQDGYPVIAYFDVTNANLKVAKCSDFSCSTTTIRSIDTAGNVGYLTSAAIDGGGSPVISYQDGTNLDLKFARVPSREVTINTTASSTGSLGTGLVGHWTFDGPDLTTATATDKSGRGNNGVLTGNSGNPKPKPAIGRLGQGLAFQNNGDWINAGKTSSLNNITLKTIALWVKTSSNGGYLVTKNAWEFKLSSRKPYFEVFTTAATGRWETQSGISPNEWHHLVVTYDNSSNSNVPVFYVDGVAVTTVVTGTPTGTQNSDSGSNLEIGGIFSGFSGGFDGVIDDVRIYNRILTADEIADLYTGTTGSVAGICGTGGVRDADGNTYGIVQIGTQCWLDRNMNVGTRVNAATTQTNNGTTEKYCYGDTASNCTDNHPKRPDGGLYQWNEAMQYSTTEGAQGICPSGWHIPTHDEFTSLERTVCTSSSCATDFPYDTTTTGARGTDEGTKLKPNGTSLWEGNLTGNSFGPGFSDRSFEGYYWSSSQNGTSGRVRQLSSGSLQVIRGSVLKTIGFSVRCIKD